MACQRRAIRTATNVRRAWVESLAGDGQLIHKCSTNQVTVVLLSRDVSDRYDGGTPAFLFRLNLYAYQSLGECHRPEHGSRRALSLQQKTARWV